MTKIESFRYSYTDGKNLFLKTVSEPNAKGLLNLNSKQLERLGLGVPGLPYITRRPFFTDVVPISKRKIWQPICGKVANFLPLPRSSWPYDSPGKHHKWIALTKSTTKGGAGKATGFAMEDSNIYRPLSPFTRFNSIRSSNYPTRNLQRSKKPQRLIDRFQDFFLPLRLTRWTRTQKSWRWRLTLKTYYIFWWQSLTFSATF